MSAEVVALLAPWDQCVNAIDQAEELIYALPAVHLADQTHQELREAAVLVQRAVEYPRASLAREGRVWEQRP